MAAEANNVEMGSERLLDPTLCLLQHHRHATRAAAAQCKRARMWRPSHPIRLVLFDAFNTLLQPTAAPYLQYAQVARKHGLYVQDDDVKTAFKAAFLKHTKTHPNYAPTPQEWWRRVIVQTFHPRSHVSLTSTELDRTVPAIAMELLHRFGTKDAYSLLPDVLPSLSTLQRGGVAMGLASNSDSRILAVLEQLGVGPYLPLKLDAAGVGGSRNPTLSYFEGVAKPHPAFFHAALRNNGVGIEKAEEVLYVGDQLDEDFVAATRAGLQAVWLNRAAQEDEEGRTEEQQHRFLHDRTVTSLVEVAETLTSLAQCGDP